MLKRRRRRLLPLLLLLTLPSFASAQQPIPFEQETLPNGLRVIYAPLHQAPVVQVRVQYHVGSRDEREDRQGFAHMFEHMMFRGSAHVKPEQHMKLVNMVGGICNAYTSFDQTVYHDTVPSNYTEMCLYLEADRMASFKVSEDIYKVERNVVAKEWGIRQNQPYGTMYEDFLKNAFTKHSYRWTPIGDMDQLKKAPVNELQDFFNKYYVPNNATLIIAGDIDVDKTKAMVKKYFAWIPAGAEVKRDIAQEPRQTAPRDVTVPKVVPLPVVFIGWHSPPFKSPDHDALNLLAAILGDGRSSRLDRLMVNADNPIAASVGANDWQLEDTSVFAVMARLLPGKDAKSAEKMMRDTVHDIIEKGVTGEELAKVKQSAKVSLVHARETADDIGSILGDETMYTGDPNRVNTALSRMEAVTPADIQRVAKTYLNDTAVTTMYVKPDPTGAQQRKNAASEVAALANTPVVPPTSPIKPRDVHFPEGYPTKPPMGDPGAPVTFEKGKESEVNGVKVIVMEDHRLPLVNWSLTIRRGSHLEPNGKEGLGSLTASMLRRGIKGMTFDQLNEDLEKRGIAVEVSDGGDFTRLFGSSMKDQADHGITRSHQVLMDPAFPTDELEKLKAQAAAGLRSSLANPSSVAERCFDETFYGDKSVLGRQTTFESLASITPDDVKQFYSTVYHPQDAFLIIAGDVTQDKGREMAKTLLDGWQSAGTLPKADYDHPAPPKGRKIILFDNPEGKQSVVRMGEKGYDAHSDDRFPGRLSSVILTSGIESRLNRYVRAEKGYSYGVYGIFHPGRQAGTFDAGTETAFDTTTPAIEAIFKVLNDMKAAEVTPAEMDDAKMRSIGSLAMGVQTIQQQADLRGQNILNDYPVDYYDKLPKIITGLTAEQVKDVMNKYVDDKDMLIIVVAPADKVKSQLDKLGEVEVRQMPDLPAGKPGAQLLK